MSDCAMDLLLSAVCMGRASRAVSIGLPIHDYEVCPYAISVNINQILSRREQTVIWHVTSLSNGVYLTFDEIL